MTLILPVETDVERIAKPNDPTMVLETATTSFNQPNTLVWWCTGLAMMDVIIDGVTIKDPQKAQKEESVENMLKDSLLNELMRNGSSLSEALDHIRFCGRYSSRST